MKKTKDEPATTGSATIPTIEVGSATELDGNKETHKETNKKQGTLRRIFTRKPSEMYALLFLHSHSLSLLFTIYSPHSSLTSPHYITLHYYTTPAPRTCSL